MRIRFGMVILLLGVWLSGCATLNPGPRRENFAPLFVYSEDEKREGRALDALGPFFTYRKDSEEKEVAFRPFFYSTREPGRYRLDYLYPLGGYERTEQRIHSYFHFVYSTDRDLTAAPTRKKQKSFLLAFWGETEEGESYGGFFPIYGNLKKRFGRDEMNFFLWPLYSDSREGESKTYTVLWPIFSYYGGVGREGFKVWPLWGYDRQENDHDKTFFLWPIFHFEKRNLYMENPTEIKMVWPLYVSMDEGTRVNRSVLWPFFNYEYDEDAHYTQWDFPWPFLQWAEGEERSILRIFPFYGRKYWLGVEKGYILFPIYLYERDEDETYRTALDRYLLFSKDQTKVWKKENKTERRLRVWPFFYYRQEKEGAVYLYSPCIIPIDLQGFEQNWAPLLTLYEYRRDPEGDSESKFLWGVYVHRQNAARDLFELSFILTYYTADDVTYLSILKGLVEYRAESSRYALRVLYSPWAMQWESRTAIAGREEKEMPPAAVSFEANVSGMLEGTRFVSP
jgi:hypothetical protein